MNKFCTSQGLQVLTFKLAALFEEASLEVVIIVICFVLLWFGECPRLRHSRFVSVHIFKKLKDFFNFSKLNLLVFQSDASPGRAGLLEVCVERISLVKL